MKLGMVVLAVALAFGTAAWAKSGYEKSYAPVAGSGADFVPSAGEPELLPGGEEPQAVQREMFQRGYGLMGASAYHGMTGKADDALKVARKIGARYVQVRWRRSDTKLVGDAKGVVTLHYFDFEAYYFGPLRRHGLGATIIPMTSAQAQAAGTNKGLAIDAVREGSPAFEADIVPGDVLLSIDGRAVYNREIIHEAVAAAFGKTITIKLMRGGARIDKTLTLSPTGDW